MTLSYVKNAIPSSALKINEAQFLKQVPTNHGRNRLNLLDRSHRVSKHAEPCSPYIELHTNSSRLVTRSDAINGHTTLFNSKNWKQEHQKSSVQSPSITRCGKEHGDTPSEENLGHEKKCKREDHTPEKHHVREWRGMRDVYSECARHGQELCRPCSQKGYYIRVSKELMGLFCYIEKRKRSTIKELADTLKQVALVAMVLTCVKGFLSPLAQVFKTTPPTWSKLLLMLVSIDSMAICYLIIKLVEPLEQLASLATENQPNIMEGVEKEEEMILRIAIGFIQLLKRLRNMATAIIVSQTMQLIFTVLKLKDPHFITKCYRVVQKWIFLPWTKFN